MSQHDKDRRHEGEGARRHQLPVNPARRHLRSKAREQEQEQEAKVTLPAACSIVGSGYLDGRHYTTYIEEIEKMLEDKHYYQALALLRRLQEAVGSYVATAGRQPAAWCEEQIHATEQAIASANARARAGSNAPEGDKMPISERFYRLGS
jgi:hypothetical protein